MKKIFFLIITLVITLQSLSFAFSSETTPEPDAIEDPTSPPYVPPKSVSTPIPDGSPFLRLESDSMMTLQANTSQVLEISIKNASSFYAKNIIVQAAAAQGNIPFMMEVIDKTNVVNSLQNGVSMKLKLKVDVDKNAAEGTYPVTLSYSFVNNNKDAFSGSDTLMIRIENNLSSPTIALTDISSEKDVLKAGERSVITGLIKNIGDQDAMDLRVTLTGLESTGISLSGGTGDFYFKNYDADFSNTISFGIIANENMKSGSYPINFKLTYRDKKGKDYETVYSYYIYVTDEAADDEEKAELTVTTVSSPDKTIGVGEQFQIMLDLKNSGMHEAKNVKISAITVEDEQIVPKTANIQQIRSLQQGENKELYFSFSPTSKSKSQNYSIGFTVEYETGAKKSDDTAEVASFTQYVGVNVFNPDEDDDDETKGSVPKIIISRYESNPLIVEAGRKFDLDMTFKNTHATKSIENIKLFISVDEETEEKGNVFSPDNSSNTFYIDRIPPKGEVSHSFKMFTVPDAQARTYTVIVNFEYEDADGNEIEAIELVGINVKQVSRLEHNDIIIPPTGFLGQPVPVSFEIYNTGKVTLNNLMVKIEGDFDVSNSNTFFGNFESGHSEYYDGIFIPNAIGEQNGKVIISYNDTNGDHKEDVYDFKINVDEMLPEDFGDMPIDGMEQTESTILAKLITILRNVYFWIGLVVTAVIIFFAYKYINKKIKQKKGMDFYE